MQRPPTAGDRDGFDSRFDAAFQPGYDDEVDLTVFDVADEVPVATTAERPVTLIDRFVIAIWAIGALLVVGSVVSVLSIADQGLMSTLDQSSFVLYSLASSLAPLLLTLGVATLIGSLFLLAHRWERRR